MANVTFSDTEIEGVESDAAAVQQGLIRLVICVLPVPISLRGISLFALENYNLILVLFRKPRAGPSPLYPASLAV